MSDEQHNKQLHDLLASLFDTPDSFRLWLSHGPEGKAVVDDVSWRGASTNSAIDDGLRQLRRRGYIDAEFFARLARDFPRRGQDITPVAAISDRPLPRAEVNATIPRLPPPDGARVLVDGNVEFIARDPRDLKPVAVVAQSLDNQWVPQAMLSEMIREGLGLADVQARRERAARSEYLRALVNADQVVVNRAFMYNNPVVSCDFVEPGEDREAFKALLAEEVIVPYLFNERSPAEEPPFTTQRFEAWREVCQEVRMSCTRLSWSDADNATITRARLTRRFHECVSSAVIQDADAYCQSLGIPPELRTSFSERLGQLAVTCTQVAVKGRHVTREYLYQQFVTRDGSPVAEGRYDRNKPFAGELKKLIDLSYNVNLPDALGRYALTPYDSLPRSALQEWKVAEKRRRFKFDDLKALIQRRLFELVQTALFIDSYGSLSLTDVHRLRRTDEWAQYLASVRDLFDDPLSFGEPNAGASLVYANFIELAHLMTRMASGPREPWTPVPELDVTIAGAVTSIRWAGPEGATFRVRGQPSFGHKPGEVPMSATLNIRDIKPASAQADLGTNVEFFSHTIEDARSTFEEFIGYLEGQSWLLRVPAEHDEDLQATINLAEAS